jgi:hypothetical protein
VYGERHGVMRKRAHVENHCRTTRDTRGLEGDIPASMIPKHLSNAVTNVIFGENKKQAHLIDLELPDECSNIILSHSTSQKPTIPINLHMLQSIPRQGFKDGFALTRLRVPA